MLVIECDSRELDVRDERHHTEVSLQRIEAAETNTESWPSDADTYRPPPARTSRATISQHEVKRTKATLSVCIVLVVKVFENKLDTSRKGGHSISSQETELYVKACVSCVALGDSLLLDAVWVQMMSSAGKIGGHIRLLQATQLSGSGRDADVREVHMI